VDSGSLASLAPLSPASAAAPPRLDSRSAGCAGLRWTRLRAAAPRSA